jgi:hypothetical protein
VALLFCSYTDSSCLLRLASSWYRWRKKKRQVLEEEEDAGSQRWHVKIDCLKRSCQSRWKNPKRQRYHLHPHRLRHPQCCCAFILIKVVKRNVRQIGQVFLNCVVTTLAVVGRGVGAFLEWLLDQEMPSCDDDMGNDELRRVTRFEKCERIAGRSKITGHTRRRRPIKNVHTNGRKVVVSEAVPVATEVQPGCWWVGGWHAHELDKD